MAIVLPEDGAVRTETCRRDLVNNNKYIFGCMCAFSWYIKDIIAVQKHAWNGKLHDDELFFHPP